METENDHGKLLTYSVICKRCGKLTHNRHHYCDDCYKEKKTNWGSYQKRKGTPTERGYGASWKRLRERVLSRDNYLCQECLRHGKITPATDVDHIIPKAEGGTDDKNNLQSLCRECHKQKTYKESRRGVQNKI